MPNKHLIHVFVFIVCCESRYFEDILMPWIFRLRTIHNFFQVWVQRHVCFANIQLNGYTLCTKVRPFAPFPQLPCMVSMCQEQDSIRHFVVALLKMFALYMLWRAKFLANLHAVFDIDLTWIFFEKTTTDLKVVK